MSPCPTPLFPVLRHALEHHKDASGKLNFEAFGSTKDVHKAHTERKTYGVSYKGEPVGRISLMVDRARNIVARAQIASAPKFRGILNKLKGDSPAVSKGSPKPAAAAAPKPAAALTAATQLIDRITNPHGDDHPHGAGESAHKDLSVVIPFKGRQFLH